MALSPAAPVIGACASPPDAHAQTKKALSILFRRSKVASDPIGPLVMVELSSHSVAWLAVGVANLLLSSTQACQDIAARAEGPRWRLAERHPATLFCWPMLGLQRRLGDRP